MKLKRCNCTIIYKKARLTEYQLLRDFSPTSIRYKIAFMNMQIKELYHLSMSHTTCSDVHGLITIGTPVETLALWIIEQKQALERYKRKSNNNMHLLKNCLNNYTKSEQMDIKRYLSSNGRYGNNDVIERFRYDLYQYLLNTRTQRINAHNRKDKLIRDKQNKQLKLSKQVLIG